MGGMNLTDATVGTYRSQIKGKKWWWPHLTNTLGVLMGVAWNIYRVTNPDEDQSLLFSNQWCNRAIIYSSGCNYYRF